MTNENIRILVVDDTITYRKIIAEILSSLPNIEIVGTAANGKIALHKIHLLKPDLVTLDLEMPIMDGLEVLEHLKKASSDVGVIVLSAFSSNDAKLTMQALSLGAFDFVLKPQGASLQENRITLRDKLRPLIDAFSRTRQVRNILKGDTTSHPGQGHPSGSEQRKPLPPDTIPIPCDGHASQFQQRIQPAFRSFSPIEIVVIGISTGGPSALHRLIPKLPADFPAPVLVVQHMPPIFTKSLAEDLNKSSPLTVREAVHGQLVQPGSVWIAPGGKQMKVRQSGTGKAIQITDDPAENSCRPAVDYLFRSVAEIYGANALGVIMTGMGNDGTIGCQLLNQRGAPIIAQDKDSCIVFGMPKEPIERGYVNRIAPLDKIASEIQMLVQRGAVA